MNQLDLPLSFIKKINNGFGDTGTVWLMDLPEIIDHCVQQWQLTNLKVCEELSYNLILFANHPTHGAVVLKIGVPHLDLFSEMEVIQLYDGRGICRCYEVDKEHGAMLLERVLPGEDLRTVLDDNERFRITGDLYKQIQTPVPEGCSLPTYQSLIEAAIKNLPKIQEVPGKLVTWLHLIKKIHKALLKETDHVNILHCDLHHMNIMRDGQGWKLIDPKGFIGLPAMECIRFMQNELDLFPTDDKKAALEKMISVFAPVLKVEPKIIRKCFFIDCVLSCYWGYEESAELEWLDEGMESCVLGFELQK